MTKTNEGFFNQDSWSPLWYSDIESETWWMKWVWQYGNRGMGWAVQAEETACTKVLKLQKPQKKKKILKEEQNDFSFYWVSPKVALKMCFWLSCKVFTLFHFNANSSNFFLLVPWLQVAPNLEAVGSKVFCESGHRSTNSVLAQNAKPNALSWNKANSSIARTLVWQPNLEYPAGPQSLGWPVVPTLGV